MCLVVGRIKKSSPLFMSAEAEFAAALAQHKHEDGTPIDMPDMPTLLRFMRARKNNAEAAALQYAKGLLFCLLLSEFVVMHAAFCQRVYIHEV